MCDTHAALLNDLVEACSSAGTAGTFSCTTADSSNVVIAEDSTTCNVGAAVVNGLVKEYSRGELEADFDCELGE